MVVVEKRLRVENSASVFMLTKSARARRKRSGMSMAMAIV